MNWMVKSILAIVICVSTLSAQETKNDDKIVETMPIYPGCENLEDSAAISQCTMNNIYKQIMISARYPKVEKSKGYSGSVYVTFLINAQGDIDSIKVLKGIKDEAASIHAAIEAVKSLPQMIPGTQRGKNVAVRYTVPVKFSTRTRGR